MKLSAVSGILLFIVLGFWACQFTFDQGAGTSLIQEAAFLKKVKSQDSIFIFLAEEGFEYQFTSGTSVSIPKSALTDHKGEIVNGPVILTFNTYRDAVDLFAAGVLMNSNQGMSKTAGAFKIEVEQSGKKLFFDPTKTIAVKLACYEKDNDYGLYFYNKKEATWEYLLTAPSTMNDPKMALERTGRKLEPRIKFPLNENYFALNYKGVLDVTYDNNLTNVNHQQTQKKMSQYGLRWFNVEVDEQVKFNGKTQPAEAYLWQNISRKSFPDWTKNQQGRLEKINDLRYNLLVINELGTQTFHTQLAPMMPLSELFSFGPGYWKSDYFNKLKLVSATENELEFMPEAFRSFRINRFGLFNWQKSIEEADSVSIKAQVKPADYNFSKYKISGFYYLTGDAKALIYYPVDEWNNFNFYNDPEARIFAILKEDELWMFPSESMKTIDFQQFQNMNDPAFIFKLEPIHRNSMTVEDLRKLLKSPAY